jgi:hypothetical protein
MKAVTECGITEKMEGIKELDKHQVDAIFANEAFKSTFARYLDCYEGFCAAVHAGVVDKDYAYTLEATKVIRAWTVFKPFVRRLRSSNEYSRCYLELERLGAAWKQQRDQEIEESNRQQGVRAAV